MAKKEKEKPDAKIGIKMETKINTIDRAISQDGLDDVCTVIHYSFVKQKEKTAAVDEVLYAEGDELPEGKEVGDVKEAAVEAQAVVYMHEDIQYHTDKIPSDVTVPDDATVTSTEKDGSKLMRKKLNPDYDESQSYSPREDRDEWHIVGLLGQIPVTKGQPTGSWAKMKDVSDTVEMYFVK